jgi:hypothetical protein
MRVVKLLTSKIVLFSILIGLFSGAIYFRFIEQPVHEYYATYSVTPGEYKFLVEHMDYYHISSEKAEVFFSPNLDSKADTLISQGIRRYEMREFYTGEFDRLAIRKYYYEDVLNCRNPQRVGDLYVGESTPIDTSLGIFILFSSCGLLLNFILRIFGVRKESAGSGK